MGKILLRKLRPRGKVYVARSYRKSRGVLGAHFVRYEVRNALRIRTKETGCQAIYQSES